MEKMESENAIRGDEIGKLKEEIAALEVKMVRISQLNTFHFFLISGFHYFECLFIPFLLKIDTDARDAILMSLVSIGCKDVSCHSSIFSVFYCVKIKSIIQFNITCF